MQPHTCQAYPTRHTSNEQAKEWDPLSTSPPEVQTGPPPRIQHPCNPQPLIWGVPWLIGSMSMTKECTPSSGQPMAYLSWQHV